MIFSFYLQNCGSSDEFSAASVSEKKIKRLRCKILGTFTINGPQDPLFTTTTQQTKLSTYTSKPALVLGNSWQPPKKLQIVPLLFRDQKFTSLPFGTMITSRPQEMDTWYILLLFSIASFTIAFNHIQYWKLTNPLFIIKL